MRPLALVVGSLVAVGSAVAAAQAADPLIEARGDLDGKRGRETVRLMPDGTLVAGAATLAVQLYPVSIDPAEYGHAPLVVRRLDVIALGGGRRGVMLVTSEPWGEDEPDRYRVFLYRKGALTLVFDRQTPGLVFSTTGTGRYLESFFETCDAKAMREGRTAKVHAVTLRLNPAGTQMVATRAPSGKVITCDFEWSG